MKIQFGCGENRLEGWENHDNDLDVTKLPLPYPDACADRIMAEHLCEHLTGPEMLRFLDECYRILKPGGKLRICVPVPSMYTMPQSHVRDLILGHGHKLVLNQESLIALLGAAGFPIFRGGMVPTNRHPDDGHWKIIGKEKDDLETCRMEATK